MSMARLALCAAVLAGALAIYLLTRGDESAPSPPPNVIVVMTDDQSLNTYTRETMANTFRLLDDGGTRFTDAYAMPPLCCPARATFQTGQYPHNHGVVQNFYSQLRDKDNILSVWLDRAGYDVGLAGKYMNEYNEIGPAPGFDHWWDLRGNPGYYDYEIVDGHHLEKAGGGRSDYTTLRTTDQAVDFIDRAAAGSDPFFLWTSYYAPHAFTRKEDPVCSKHTAQVLPEDWARFKDAPVDLPPEFNEADVSDKPPMTSSLEPLDSEEIANIEADIRCSMAAVYRVDKGIGEIVSALRDAGAEDDTAIFFISDNGLFFGEHRHTDDKAQPYRADQEVPMAARVPADVLGSAAAAQVSQPTGTLDLAPTILDLAGADPCNAKECRVMDGRSLLDVMRGDAESWPEHRARLAELGNDCGNFASVQRDEWVYTEWYEGEPPDACRTIFYELYDLRNDPGELENLLGPEPVSDVPEVDAKAEAMAGLLARERTCSGIEGRDETKNPCE